MSYQLNLFIIIYLLKKNQMINGFLNSSENKMVLSIYHYSIELLCQEKGKGRISLILIPKDLTQIS